MLVSILALEARVSLLPASSFDTSFDNDKPASSSFVTLVTLNCVTVTFFIDSQLRKYIMLLYF